MCPRRLLPQLWRQELTISYGDKSNEELLFLYGFAVPNNPAEVLTLMCPLPPPAEWDALLRARLLLLAGRGLSPRLHLPAADLPAAEASQGVAAQLPEGVLETLEVFIMAPERVAAELEAAEAAEAAAAAATAAGSAGAASPAAAAAAASGSSSQGSSVSGGKGNEAEVAGRRMAVLTTLVRLLEVKLLEMEGQEEGGCSR